MTTDEIVFNSMEGWKGGDKTGITFEQMIMEQIKKCALAGSVEMKGGWYEHHYSADGVETKTYVPSTYDAYTNSVQSLRSLMIGYFDDEFREKDQKLREEMAMVFENMETKNRQSLTQGGWFDYEAKMYRIVFEELLLLAKRLNFFKEEAGEEDT